MALLARLRLYYRFYKMCCIKSSCPLFVLFCGKMCGRHKTLNSILPVQSLKGAYIPTCNIVHARLHLTLLGSSKHKEARVVLLL